MSIELKSILDKDNEKKLSAYAGELVYLKNEQERMGGIELRSDDFRHYPINALVEAGLIDHIDGEYCMVTGRGLELAKKLEKEGFK